MKLPVAPEAAHRAPEAANSPSSRSGLKLGIVRLGRAGGKVGHQPKEEIKPGPQGKKTSLFATFKN